MFIVALLVRRYEFRFLNSDGLIFKMYVHRICPMVLSFKTSIFRHRFSIQLFWHNFYIDFRAMRLSWTSVINNSTFVFINVLAANVYFSISFQKYYWKYFKRNIKKTTLKVDVAYYHVKRGLTVRGLIFSLKTAFFFWSEKGGNRRVQEQQQQQ